MTKKKTTTKPKPTLKEKLIEEAQKLIGITAITPNFTYCLYKVDERLVFGSSEPVEMGAVKILQIPGTKILKGLEEYQWDVYGDALVFHFGPKEIENKKDSTEKTDNPLDRVEAELINTATKPLTVDFYINQAQQLLKEITIKARSNYYFLERSGVLLLVPDVECQESDELLFCVIGQIAKAGYSKAQLRDIGKKIHDHFNMRAS